MNLLLLLTAVAAIASIVWLLTSSLKWKWRVILPLGMTIASAAGIALLLDYLTPLTNFEWAGETVTGLPFYMPGPSASILGKGYGFIFIAFCWGVGLMVVALVKRSKQTPLVAAPEPDEEELTEAENIHSKLKKAISEERNRFDPTKAGEDDATKDGGPFPKESDADPSRGYELDIRNRLETIGSDFLRSTVTRLRKEIENALKKLENIREEINRQSYKEIARAHYSENRTEIAPHIVKRNQHAYTKTEQERKVFINSLHKLGKAGQPDWAEDDRTTRETLIVWGIAFALVEFAISWFFLKSQIGESAIQIAGYAVVIIFSLAFFAGFFFRFMRHNQPPHIRVPAVIGYACICFGIFLGLGLLLNFREFSVSGDFASRFDAILSGYDSLTVNLTNLVVFLVNLVALAAFYWKVLHFFDKFHGYGQVNKPFRLAKERWEGMYDKAQEKISSALGHANDKAIANSEDAKESFDDIQRKRGALENIKSIITSAYQEIILAYREDIKDYRKSNLENRALAVNPAPSYFDDQPPFCDIEQYLSQANDVETFLSQNQKKLEHAEKDLSAVAEGKTQWQTDRPALLTELTSEFDRMIAAARTGTATEPALPKNSEQQETDS